MTASGRFASVTDGLSNSVLTVERQAFCYGPNYPRVGTPNLSAGSVTFSIWARGGRNTTHNAWVDGVPAAANLTAVNNAGGADGYTWWDCPLLDAPLYYQGKQIFNPVKDKHVVPEGISTKDFIVPPAAGQNIRYEQTADF